jgi:ABC-type dipeptide/oligopeptide/nickel transport system ATPase component
VSASQNGTGSSLSPVLTLLPEPSGAGFQRLFWVRLPTALHRPGLLIADEPTSALDVITQAEILNLFASINRRLGTAILYISHDLFSISRLCDRVAILHEGEIVEIGETERLMASPSHPYTRRLIQSSPLSVSVPNKLKHECFA